MKKRSLPEAKLIPANKRFEFSIPYGIKINVKFDWTHVLPLRVVCYCCWVGQSLYSLFNNLFLELTRELTTQRAHQDR